MNINYEKLEKKFWFEDENGNEVDGSNPSACYYRHCFPLELHDVIDEYCYHPKIFLLSFCAEKAKSLINGFQKESQKHLKPFLIALQLTAVDKSA